MKTILVTGGCGFIGQHLCENLCSQGHLVYCLDNLSTGDVANTYPLVLYPNFRFIYGDTTWEKIKVRILEQMVRDGIKKIDEIYHLASPASPVHYLQHPMETIEANTIGLRNILDLAMYFKSKILFTSTSEVYGDPDRAIQCEAYNGNVNPNGDRAVYDESKRLGETFMSLYRRLYGLDTRIVRLFNTYGPGMARNDGRVIPEFIDKALKGEPLKLFGGGLQTRSFCYITDTIDGIVRVMESEDNRPINIGNPKEYYSILTLAQMIIELTKSKSEIITVPFISQNDPEIRCPSIKRANIQLLWHPKINIFDGLKYTIEYFQRN